MSAMPSVVEPQDAVPKRGFMDELRDFYESRSIPLKAPVFNRQEMNLEKLWNAVREYGGSARVCQLKRWAAVGRRFNPPRSMTNLSYHVKRIYARCLLAYERHLYPELAMSEELDQPGPFSNKRCVDEHIYYGPALVTKNKRQKRGGKTKKKSKAVPTADMPTEELPAPERSSFVTEVEKVGDSHRGLHEWLEPEDHLCPESPPAAPLAHKPNEEETEQAAAMLWGLSRSDLMDSKGGEKEEPADDAQNDLDMRIPTSDDAVGSDHDDQPRSPSTSVQFGIDVYGLEDWYQRRISEINKRHREEMSRIKKEVKELKTQVMHMEGIIGAKEAAEQECRWCYQSLLQVVRPVIEEHRADGKLQRLSASLNEGGQDE